MIKLSNLSLRRGSKLLFKDASFQIHTGQKVGITGANGCGKSSLFALILDQLHADTGDYSHPADWVIAHVSQSLPNSSQAAIEYVLDGDQELRTVQLALNDAEKQNNGSDIARLHVQLENIDGYTANARAASLLSGLGFKQQDHSAAVSSFSGGWQMRLNLARALMCRSDLLLLDEPTNHLDIETIIWLESWLSSYQGTLLLISHDRDFLNNVCSHIAHIEHQHISLYRGNYDAFEALRSEQLSSQQAEYEKQQKTISQIESFVSRFKAKASKAKQAQSRLKTLQSMQRISPAHVDSEYHFKFIDAEKIPASLLQLVSVSFAYNSTNIIESASMQLTPGDRIGLLGLNGAGKTTLIKLLAGQLPVNTGERHVNTYTRIGYFAQHQLELLQDAHSPVEHIMQIDNSTPESEARDFLGRFGFSGDSAITSIKGFSGGERSRLALALIVFQRPNLLLLDEPTNHLDLEMRQALAVALQSYNGAMVIVSHDRYLINACCDQLYVVNRGQLAEFNNSLDDYPSWVAEQAGVNDSGKKSRDSNADYNRLSRKERKQQEALQREKTSPLRKQLNRLEAELDDTAEKINAIEQQLADNTIYDEDNKDRLKELIHKKSELGRHHSQCEEQWLTLSEQIEVIQKEFS
jgi:ATP-binding cassette subfamily F protein 3